MDKDDLNEALVIWLQVYKQKETIPDEKKKKWAKGLLKLATVMNIYAEIEDKEAGRLIKEAKKTAGNFDTDKIHEVFYKLKKAKKQIDML
ncbi:MAG: hypothetical protein ACLFP1_07545 [Candidatus Goldiibacteriota bacterium]